MSIRSPTHIGDVASVAGSIVSVRLRSDVASNLLLIDGSSYRIGQIGSFYRVPLGYTYLYAVCTAAGAAAIPSRETYVASPVAIDNTDTNEHRWLKLVLFGESIGDRFQRGVGQYPTIGDEVHVVTPSDMDLIYRHSVVSGATISIGSIAGAAGIAANLDVAKLVGRHCAVVGSTGTGKSNLVTVLLDALANDKFPSARVVVVDPHGEYGAALPDQSQLLTIRPMDSDEQSSLVVPFWALPLDELLELTIGRLQPMVEATIREQVLEMKKQSICHLDNVSDVTADSPYPFHIGRLWLELDRFEKLTFENLASAEKRECEAITKGDAEKLIPYQYPPASPYNKPPYKNPQVRNIGRQLDLMVSRLRDPRFSFLFRPGKKYTPDDDGKVVADLDQLMTEWVGHDRPVTIFDVSGMPSEVLQTVVGTMLRIIYDMLFWGQQLPVGGQQQPLLIVVDEAHRFIPKGTNTGAHRTLSMIAKEGRKYGIGLLLVSQRPSEMDSDVLSQFGSLIALRISNTTDRAEVAATLPDDLGGLIDLLPSLRTGEAVVIGDVVPIPSRVRIRKAGRKTVGSDPRLPETWQTKRPDARLYENALANWRAQSIGDTHGHE